MEYNVTWGDGNLGLTLRAELGDDMPPVVGRITREDSAAALAGVAVGHMLVSVNGVETARRGYNAIVHMLKTIPRPCVLRFRVPKSLAINNASIITNNNTRHSDTARNNGSTSLRHLHRKRETYSVEWVEGPLGMIFRPDDIDCHIPCIRKITGKGLGSRGIERARVGDILLEINGAPTKEIGFRQSISTLKSLEKPAILKFKRMRRRVSRSRDKEGSEAVPANVHALPPPIVEEPDVPPAPAPTIPHTLSSPPSPRPVAEPPVVSIPDANDLVHLPLSTKLTADAGMYDIVWREGELGLKLKPTPSDVPMISRLTGKGTASGLHNAHIGDVLVTVNGKFVDESSYTSTLRLLKHTPKPIILRFRPIARDHHVIAADSVSLSMSSFHKRDQIPLDVAKQLVATSQGLDIMRDEFAGVPIREIVEGSNEANYLRVAAKAYVTIQADKKRGQKKAELTRAEREAQVLAEALEQLKEQARKYEEMLAKQKMERILRPATENKSKAMIATANSLFAELKSSDKFFSRDSIDFTHLEVNQDHLDKMRDDVLKDLNSITSSSTEHLVIPASAQKRCFQCAALETTLLPFYLDDSDNQWYCETCWVQYYGDPLTAVVHEEEEAVVEVVAVAPVEEVEVGPTEAEAPSPPVDEITPLVSLPAPTVAAAPPKAGLSRRPSTREDLSLLKEIEEKQARREAERMIKELEEIRRSSALGAGNNGSFSNGNSASAVVSTERLSQPSSTDRMERDKRGKEELARHLQAAEEKAKADGNDALARKLEAQRKRSLLDVTTMSRSASEGGASISSVRDSSGPASPTKSEDDVRGFHDDEEVDTYDEEEEEYDQDTELLQNREDQNFAMAKELQRMHEVVHQAHRMSMMMMGEEEDSVTEFTGLSSDQVNLFRKLALESDHRVSMATHEYFRGHEDDSDSDEDSDAEEGDGVWI
ncbi:hypothetical protein DYB32_005672 [Aphanomyces invadans]|uniref:PDZ domain-containing protein n=1 Tax=Aphanomyces invadans TaxID=157072 RepID=A0A3R6ZP93_9STRA|nr:hypothetical protein DYB32_005672 [Aphanomyces invadans]